MEAKVIKDSSNIIDRRREEILNVALREFSRKGYSGTRVSDIAKKSRISQGLVYHYYNSKEDLYLAVSNRVVEVCEELTYIISTSKIRGWQGLLALTEEVIDWIINNDHRLFILCFLHQISILESKPCDKYTLRKENEILIVIKRLICEGQKEGKIIMGKDDLLGRMYWSVIQCIIINKVMGNDKEYGVEDLNPLMLLRGLRN
ncbi:TetR/AcrR family transcriptional regulator [Clostridium sp.]|uniref:TetR/AcrR family transcriptional regulator n=1 Tax=Clostridium sp. TaxID=1506 RepID=UPI003464E89D